MKVEPHSALFSLLRYFPLCCLHGGIIQYLIPDLLLLPASCRLHERPTHPREIGWPGVRVDPFAFAALDAAPATLRRGSRTRAPSVRLRSLGDVQLPPMEHLGDPRHNRSCMPMPVESTPPMPPPPAVPQFPVDASNDDLGEVLSAGEEVTRSTEPRHVIEGPAIHRAVQVLTNPALLVRRQRDDDHLGQVCTSLCGSSGTG